MGPKFIPLGLLACALLAVNALLVRFQVGAFERILIPITALLLLAIAFGQWRRG
jgi:hypothetical protein